MISFVLFIFFNSIQSLGGLLWNFSVTMTAHSGDIAENLRVMAIEEHGGPKLVDRNTSSASNPPYLQDDDSQDLVQSTGGVVTSTQMTCNATETFSVENLKSMCCKDKGVPFEQHLIEKLLDYYDEQIQQIVRRALENAESEEVSWKAAEECYQQAIRPFGTLNAHSYLNRPKEAQSRQRVDSVFERKTHVEHDKVEQEWIRFWINALHQSLGGPTLFCPQVNSTFDLPSFFAVPRYLFRTFDEKSSGENNETTFASSGSVHGKQKHIDLLRMEDLYAAKLLHYHLDSCKFGGARDEEDNLVSWTSSLLFAIQCAIYRHHRPNLCGNDIKICMVDTSQFPKGQFVRDTQLIENYEAAAQGNLSGISNLRLRSKHYYNGEYLSQGVLNHEGRSHVVSFQQLKAAGLYNLYPEFKEKDGASEWANRVKSLRMQWQHEQISTDENISWARKIAQICFPLFDPVHVGCILLAFKNRKLSSKLSSFIFSVHHLSRKRRRNNV
jgi:hypothetical protein